MKHQRHLFWLLVLVVIFTIQACGKSSSESGTGTGSMAVSFTDAPGDFEHAWITVKDIWIHTSDAADPRPHGGGWLKYPLVAPKTVDLLTLANGNAQSIWDNIQLPIGNYQQIRIVLVDTDDPLTASAATAGLKYNNEIVINGSECPLHIPDARHGIRLVGAFKVTEGGTLKLAIDFDAGHDIVEFRGTEYILKPRLAYFDLDNVGAIIGQISTGGSFTIPHFVIKAEKLNDNGTQHVLRRWTVPDATGKFVLFPVPAVTTTAYDIVLRGLDFQTVIIKGVPVTRGTTPTSGATDIGTIIMTAATTSDYSVDGTITSPTGAWVEFDQTLPGAGEVPYQIRFRHFNPLLGKFSGFRLSNDQIQVGNYISSGVTSGLTTTTPKEGVGGYSAIAEAILYTRSTPTLVTSGTTTVAFNSSLTVQSPWQGNSVTGSITMMNPMKMNNKMDAGVLFAIHGGMIVNAISLDSSQMATGGTYTMTNLPGGTAGIPLPGAFYGIEAVGWLSTPMSPYKAIAVPSIVDLRIGNDIADMPMVPLW